MQFASSLSTLESSPRPSTSAFGLVSSANNAEVPNNWAQVPPTYMPWGNPTAPQPSIVRFTAEPLDKPGPSGLNITPFGQCKRKIDAEMPLSVCRREPGIFASARLGARAVQGCRRGVHTLDTLRPVPKQLITEEKMAAHMRQLHISSTYTSHENPSMEGTMAAKPDLAVNISPIVPAEDQAYKRLVLCEELRQLQNEPILPPSLLSQMQRPSMALVLWQPPAGKMGDALSRAAASSSSAEEEMENERQRQRQSQNIGRMFSSVALDNNNFSGAVDLNTIQRFPLNNFISRPGAETMDL